MIIILDMNPKPYGVSVPFRDEDLVRTRGSISFYGPNSNILRISNILSDIFRFSVDDLSD